MTGAWSVILALTIGTAAIKAAGPLAVGGRELPPALMRVIALLAPVLLAALLVVETFVSHGAVGVDARAVGLAAAAVTLSATGSLTGAVASSAVVTALVRLAL